VSARFRELRRMVGSAGPKMNLSAPPIDRVASMKILPYHGNTPSAWAISAGGKDSSSFLAGVPLSVSYWSTKEKAGI